MSSNLQRRSWVLQKLYSVKIRYICFFAQNNINSQFNYADITVLLTFTSSSNSIPQDLLDRKLSANFWKSSFSALLLVPKAGIYLPHQYHIKPDRRHNIPISPLAQYMSLVEECAVLSSYYFLKEIKKNEVLYLPDKREEKTQK